MEKPIVTRAVGGEYSTVRLTDGCIETMWFGDDGDTRTVGRYFPMGVRAVAKMHIESDNN